MSTHTLKEMLELCSSRYAETLWDKRVNNDTLHEIIERFDDCPEALKDFYISDWVNLCEPYTFKLLRRWNNEESDIRYLFEAYLEDYGFTSTLEAMEGVEIVDGDDLNAEIVNRAMTYGAQMIAREIYPDL